MIFGDYYSAMDRGYGKLEPNDNSLKDEFGKVVVSGLGPEHIGTTTHPFQHQVHSFGAKIRSGAGKIELSFIGQGKGSSQQPTPESFDKKDRETIRALAEINKIKTSVHASAHMNSLAGFGREGFSSEERQRVLTEIEKAIHFASEATKGGAVVVHTHEWQRPMIDFKSGEGKNLFRGPGEREIDQTGKEITRAPRYVVDERTGEVNAVRMDHQVYEPKFYTAKEYEAIINKKLVGDSVDDPFNKGNKIKIEANDWVDLEGNPIKREWILDKKKAEKLFDRVPVFDTGKTNFKVEKHEFKEYIDEAERLKKSGIKGAEHITPEELFFKTHLANQVLQLKGNSLYHARSYEQEKQRADIIKKKIEQYESIVNNKSFSPDRKALMLLDSEKEYAKLVEDKARNLARQALSEGKLAPENDKIQEFTQKAVIDEMKKIMEKNTIKKSHEESLKFVRDSLRHVHEASASADAQAQQILDKLNNMVSVEKYGLDKTAETLSKAAMKAREYSEKNKKDLDENLFIAPENYRPEMYGSHPDEIRNIVKASRKKMADDLVKNHKMDAEKAKKESEKYIKATIDSGHFNMWRQFFQSDAGDSIEKRNEKFNKWMLSEMDKLAKEGLLGHVHLTDNFGYDDEHLTPGQGNTPIVDFIKTMEKHGIKDFIAEAGSFNGETVLQDTWSLVGSPIYSAGGAPSFRAIHQQHFGYHNPSTYIVGAYAPSNEWRLWSETPFE